MATHDCNSASLNESGLSLTDTSAILSKDRHNISIDAAAEVLEMSRLMLDHSVSRSLEPLTIRGLAMRVEELASIIIGALGEEAETSDGLAYRLGGMNYKTLRGGGNHVK